MLIRTKDNSRCQIFDIRLLIACIAPIVTILGYSLSFLLTSNTPRICIHQPCYCEHINKNQTIAQPINAFSSLSFSVMAIGIGLYSTYYFKRTPSKNRFFQVAVYPFLYCAVVALLGVGAFAYHVYLSESSELFDAICVYMYVSVLIAITITQHIPLNTIAITFYILIPVILTTISSVISIYISVKNREYVTFFLIIFYLTIETPYLFFKKNAMRMWFVIASIFQVAAFLFWLFSKNTGDVLCNPTD
jgi:hypothetical protein